MNWWPGRWTVTSFWLTPKVICNTNGKVKESFLKPLPSAALLCHPLLLRVNKLSRTTCSSTVKVLFWSPKRCPFPALFNSNIPEPYGACTFDPHPPSVLRALSGGTGQAGEASHLLYRQPLQLGVLCQTPSLHQSMCRQYVYTQIYACLTSAVPPFWKGKTVSLCSAPHSSTFLELHTMVFTSP